MSDFVYGAAGTAGVFLLGVLALRFFTPGGEGATLSDRILSTPLLAPTLILHYFLPYGLIILTLFMDVMSQLPQGVFGLLIGFGLMFVNWGIGRATVGVPDFPNDLCEIPGMKGIASKFVPQSLLFVSAVVFYLASFVTVSSSKNLLSTTTRSSDTSNLINVDSTISAAVSPSRSARVGASWGLAGSVVLFQLLSVISTPGCLTDPLPIPMFTNPLPATARAILAVLIGGAVGGGSAVGFANLSITQPTYSVTTSANVPTLPFVPGGLLPPPNQNVNPSPLPPQSRGPGFVREQFQLGSGLGEMPMPPQGGGAPIDIAKSSGAVTPGESSDQFVCEAYKNGQLVTSTLVG